MIGRDEQTLGFARHYHFLVQKIFGKSVRLRLGLRWLRIRTSPNPDLLATKHSTPGTPLDYFQIQVSLSNTQDTSLDAIFPRKTNPISLHPASASIFMQERWLRNTPIRQLLVVSGESWIMGKKLENEGEFQDAKRNLRVWVESNLESRVALWHALRLIRGCAKFMPTDSTNTGLFVSFHDTQMLHEPWVLYLAAFGLLGIWSEHLEIP